MEYGGNKDRVVNFLMESVASRKSSNHLVKLGVKNIKAPPS